MTSSLLAGLPNIGNISSVLQGASTSFLIAAFLAFALFVIGITVGKSKLIIAMVSIYVTLVIVELLPYKSRISQATPSLPDYILNLAILAAAYVIVFFLLSKSMSRTKITLAETSLLSIIMLSLIQAGFVISTLVSVLPEPLFSSVGPSLRYFATPAMRFFWSVLPLVSFLFLRPRRYFRN